MCQPAKDVLGSSPQRCGSIPKLVQSAFVPGPACQAWNIVRIRAYLLFKYPPRDLDLRLVKDREEISRGGLSVQHLDISRKEQHVTC